MWSSFSHLQLDTEGPANDTWGQEMHLVSYHCGTGSYQTLTMNHYVGNKSVPTRLSHTYGSAPPCPYSGCNREDSSGRLGRTEAGGCPMLWAPNARPERGLSTHDAFRIAPGTQKWHTDIGYCDFLWEGGCWWAGNGCPEAGRKPEVWRGAPGLVSCPNLPGDAIHPGEQVPGLAVESQGVGCGADVQAGVLAGCQQLLPALHHLLLPAGDGLGMLSGIHRPQLGCPLLQLPYLRGTPGGAPALHGTRLRPLFPPSAGWVQSLTTQGAHTLLIPHLGFPVRCLIFLWLTCILFDLPPGFFQSTIWFLLV